jgi:hypothetical protein
MGRHHRKNPGQCARDFVVSSPLASWRAGVAVATAGQGLPRSEQDRSRHCR